MFGLASVRLPCISSVRHGWIAFCTSPLHKFSQACLDWLRTSTLRKFSQAWLDWLLYVYLSQAESGMVGLASVCLPYISSFRHGCIGFCTPILRKFIQACLDCLLYAYLTYVQSGMVGLASVLQPFVSSVRHVWIGFCTSTLHKFSQAWLDWLLYVYLTQVQSGMVGLASVRLPYVSSVRHGWNGLLYVCLGNVQLCLVHKSSNYFLSFSFIFPVKITASLNINLVLR